jgi:hypothetical protein
VGFKSPLRPRKPRVTYSGHPIYTFTGDQKAGDTNGQGVSAFGASWFALTSAGTQVSGQASGGITSSGGTSSTSGASG